MSLASTAASWVHDESAPTRKKHFPIRKTMRNGGGGGGSGAAPLGGGTGTSPYMLGAGVATGAGAAAAAAAVSPPSVEDIMRRIDSLQQVQPNDDGSGLADFRPPPMPELTKFPPPPPLSLDNNSNNNIPLDARGAAFRPTRTLPQNNFDSVASASALPQMSKVGAANSLGMFSNYRNAYDPHDTLYYGGRIAGGGSSAAAMPFGGGGAGVGGDSKLIEKINYLVHMMEEQQLVKNNYVMEEIILYAYLGVFIIFVCDSFVRMGQKMRRF